MAFVTLFRILSGDTWPPGLDVYADTGAVDPFNALFMISFRLIVDWILLQVPPHGFGGGWAMGGPLPPAAARSPGKSARPLAPGGDRPHGSRRARRARRDAPCEP